MKNLSFMAQKNTPLLKKWCICILITIFFSIILIISIKYIATDKVKIIDINEQKKSAIRIITLF